MTNKSRDTFVLHEPRRVVDLLQQPTAHDTPLSHNTVDAAVAGGKTADMLSSFGIIKVRVD